MQKSYLSGDVACGEDPSSLGMLFHSLRQTYLEYGVAQARMDLDLRIGPQSLPQGKQDVVPWDSLACFQGGAVAWMYENPTFTAEPFIFPHERSLQIPMRGHCKEYGEGHFSQPLLEANGQTLGTSGPDLGPVSRTDCGTPELTV